MTCPICARPVEPKYKPFCSRRCADVDLARWLTGSYVLPGQAVDDDADPDPAADADSGPAH